MNKIFDVCNKNTHRAIFIIAPDDKTAVQIALKLKLAKTESAIKPPYETTKQYREINNMNVSELDSILSSGKVGQLVLQISSFTFQEVAKEIMGTKVPKPLSLPILCEIKL